MVSATTASLMSPMMTPFPFAVDVTNSSLQDPMSAVATVAASALVISQTTTAENAQHMALVPSDPLVPRSEFAGGLTPASMALIIIGATAPVVLLVLVAIIARCRKMDHRVPLKPRRGRRRDVTYAAEAVNSVDAATAAATTMPSSAWRDHNGKAAWNDDEMASFNGGADGGCKILTELAVREFFDVQLPTTPRLSAEVRRFLILQSFYNRVGPSSICGKIKSCYRNFM